MGYVAAGHQRYTLPGYEGNPPGMCPCRGRVRRAAEERSVMMGCDGGGWLLLQVASGRGWVALLINSLTTTFSPLGPNLMFTLITA